MSFILLFSVIRFTGRPRNYCVVALIPNLLFNSFTGLGHCSLESMTHSEADASKWEAMRGLGKCKELNTGNFSAGATETIMLNACLISLLTDDRNRATHAQNRVKPETFDAS